MIVGLLLLLVILFLNPTFGAFFLVVGLLGFGLFAFGANPLTTPF